ncbi:MAG: alpha/beta hydrolase [Elusimicrobiota bacterium]|nr:alpha/beta hydrolase [Elusimicrobiota bacterium]
MFNILCFTLLLAAPANAGSISREVSWNIGATTVAATITLPDGPGPHPGVALVPGSGPTDRDWRSALIPGPNGSASLLAAELAKAGFAVIRYDKRFTGPYAAGNLPLLHGRMSFQSHLEEVAGAVQMLKKNSAVDQARVFALTNSEGAIHALNCHLSSSPAFAGLVLTGAPGRKMLDVLRSQIGAQVAAMPEGPAIMAGLDKLLANFMAGLPFAADPALPPSINQFVAGFHHPANLPFMRELFTADVPGMAAKAGVPLLILTGKKDVQISWELDGRPLEAALAGNKAAKFIYPENANHVLKYEGKPREELSGQDGLSYNAEGKILDPDALKEIISWLRTLAFPAEGRHKLR